MCFWPSSECWGARKRGFVCFGELVVGIGFPVRVDFGTFSAIFNQFCILQFLNGFGVSSNEAAVNLLWRFKERAVIIRKRP